jgi:hypothetical protein
MGTLVNARVGYVDLDEPGIVDRFQLILLFAAD